MSFISCSYNIPSKLENRLRVCYLQTCFEENNSEQTNKQTKLPTLNPHQRLCTHFGEVCTHNSDTRNNGHVKTSFYEEVVQPKMQKGNKHCLFWRYEYSKGTSQGTSIYSLNNCGFSLKWLITGPRAALLEFEVVFGTVGVPLELGLVCLQDTDVLRPHDGCIVKV